MLGAKYRFNFAKEDENHWDRPLFLKKQFQELDEAWQLYRAILVDAKKLCDENKIPLAVSSIPFLIEFDDMMKQDSSLQPGLVTEKISNVCRELNVPYINLYERFKNSENPTSLFWVGDQHFNGAGHVVTAEGLINYYKKEIR